MLKSFRWAIGLTVIALVVAGVTGGPAALFTVAILGVLEISLSFDNAVVNAGVLRRLDVFWRKMFLTLGIVIAVFGMRLVLPVVIVAATTPLGFFDVINLALHDSAAYGKALHGSEHEIYAFGGIFLFLIFLDFALDTDREITWLRGIEKGLQKIGKVDTLNVMIALVAIIVGAILAGPEEKYKVLLSGLFGMLAYLAVSALDSYMEDGIDESDDAEGAAAATGRKAGPGGVALITGKAGIGAFIYLEILDASFSFDGVIGAFAISNQILVIALGLGIGAFWIRSLTLVMVDRGDLDKYVYLEHGAMWAIGVLAVLMVMKIGFSVPEAVTGGLGVGFLAVAIVCSRIETRRGTYDGNDNGNEDQGPPAVVLSVTDGTRSV